MITAAVSEMLLSSNRNTLRSFRVESPLTEEARGVIYQLPDLTELLMVIEEDASLPSVLLPSLINLTISCDHDNNWSRAFRGATLGKLESVRFDSGSEQAGDFLEAFETVALAASAQNTLSTFSIYASWPWSPNYSSLLRFTQLTDLVIEFPCWYDGCASTVDDEVITHLARAIPELKLLQMFLWFASSALWGNYDSIHVEVIQFAAGGRYE